MSATTAAPRPRHILTIVVEDYFQVGAFRSLIPSDRWDRFETRLEHSTDAALRMLDETGNRATFFASGWIGDHHPAVLRRIDECGHELACQGYFQHAVGDIAPAAFLEDVRRSKGAVENAVGKPVAGFRIGRGWIGPNDLWALASLAEAGFRYDSSVCPLGREFGNEPHRAFVHEERTEHGPIIEVPATSWRFLRWSVPISGGNYFRQLPDWPLRTLVARRSRIRDAPLVLYFHTWELDATQPTITAAGMVQRIRHYRNLKRMPGKIRHFLDAYELTTIAERLKIDAERLKIDAERLKIDAERLKIDVDTETPIRTAPAESAGAIDASEVITTGRPLTIVIPCFNEEKTLPYLKRTLEHFAAGAGRQFSLRFVGVDDGSTDGTWALLHELFGATDTWTLVRHDENVGIAGALVTGFAETRSELVAVMDADCTFDPSQLPEMYALLTDDVDVVTASPAHERGAMKHVPFWRASLSKGAAFLYRRVLHHKLTSYTSCFRIYRRRTLDGLAVYQTGFCGVAEILGRIDLAGYRIVEYPAVLETRLLGESKIRILKTVLEHVSLLARLAAARWLGRELPRPEKARA